MDSPPWAEPVFLLEVTLPEGARGRDERSYRPLPEFPGSERDLALLVPEAVTAEAVERVIRAAGGELLRSVVPFDLYAGKGIPEGTTSVAWRLRFRGRTARSPTRRSTGRSSVCCRRWRGSSMSDAAERRRREVPRSGSASSAPRTRRPPRSRSGSGAHARPRRR